ncbi:hypothetical protein L596_029319 [Steinernema carpocapsae]|uniref:Uncharacterized protein n=1 Tax=Steinernema carpocapsae TaxID=34508 RepID=A0A4U5LUA4_STECR|nr:hypothetical protein L596_029319 [Steinernema carpocapsae]
MVAYKIIVSLELMDCPFLLQSFTSFTSKTFSNERPQYCACISAHGGPLFELSAFCCMCRIVTLLIQPSKKTYRSAHVRKKLAKWNKSWNLDAVMRMLQIVFCLIVPRVNLLKSKVQTHREGE